MAFRGTDERLNALNNGNVSGLVVANSTRAHSSAMMKFMIIT